MDVATLRTRALDEQPGTMTFAPRFAPDGRRVVFSWPRAAIPTSTCWTCSRARGTRLTNTPAIETAPSFSPDGSQIVFESDRSGTQQLYIMSAGGGEARRISLARGAMARRSGRRAAT
jgi:TolB protein